MGENSRPTNTHATLAPLRSTTFTLSKSNFLSRRGPSGVAQCLQNSCDRLSTGYVDLYQVQFPKFYWGGRGKLIGGVKNAKDRGLANFVGVSGGGGSGGSGVEKVVKRFEGEGVKVSSFQVEFR